MQLDDAHFEVRLARTPEELRAAQRLRFEVFVEELGATGPMVDHRQRLEADRFDPFFEHLILLDHRRPSGEKVVGVYRVMQANGAARAGQYYSEDEYDLSALKTSGRRLLELGRSCVHSEYRSGIAMMHLWNGLARYIADQRIDILFGVASFQGADPAPLAAPLSLLHHRHLAPEDIRPVARAPGGRAMDICPPEEINRATAIRAIPSLIKAYLRLGGFVGKGAYIDTAFNCVDVCLVMDVARMSPKHRAIYQRSAA